MIQFRLRTRTSQPELEEKKGKLLTDKDHNLILTGPARALKPDGTPLAIYLPGVLKPWMASSYDLLHKIRLQSDNRGLASGTKRINAGGTRTRAMPIHSGILGAIDPTPRRPYCRLNAYSRNNLDQWKGLYPLLQQISSNLRQHVPERHQTQAEQVSCTHPDWVVPGTVFTTITINNSYSTGVHTDKGDLEEGFSCLAVARRGQYTGGKLCFPEYRIAVDMQDGDLLLMDAHEWHGNTPMICGCGERMNRLCESCAAERISVVCYYRTHMISCGSKTEEDQKFHALKEAENV